MQNIRELIVCKDGFTVSIQASANHYCSPKVDGINIVYSSVELGMPNQVDPLLVQYAENQDNLLGTAYGWVPSDIVVAVIEKHGGVISGTLPKFALKKIKTYYIQSDVFANWLWIDRQDYVNLADTVVKMLKDTGRATLDLQDYLDSVGYIDSCILDNWDGEEEGELGADFDFDFTNVEFKIIYPNEEL